MDNIKLNTVEEALEDFRKGEFVIVVDDEDRENEGDMICAAESRTYCWALQSRENRSA